MYDVRSSADFRRRVLKISGWAQNVRPGLLDARASSARRSGQGAGHENSERALSLNMGVRILGFLETRVSCSTFFFHGMAQSAMCGCTQSTTDCEAYKCTSNKACLSMGIVLGCTPCTPCILFNGNRSWLYTMYTMHTFQWENSIFDHVSSQNAALGCGLVGETSPFRYRATPGGRPWGGRGQKRPRAFPRVWVLRSGRNAIGAAPRPCPINHASFGPIRTLYFQRGPSGTKLGWYDKVTEAYRILKFPANQSAGNF